MSEHDANRDLAHTARMRALAAIDPMHDPLEDTQRMPVHERRERAREAVAGPRERRKPSTVGERETRNAVENARDIFADRQQELIEAKLWPQY